MEMPCWCSSEGHQHGGWKSRKRLELPFAMRAITFPLSPSINTHEHLIRNNKKRPFFSISTSRSNHHLQRFVVTATRTRPQLTLIRKTAQRWNKSCPKSPSTIRIKQDNFVTVSFLFVTYGRNLEHSRCRILNTTDLTSLKLVKRHIF